ncbi:MAG: cytochrome c biogenesis protein CcsA [Elusimicrobia bacterium]|nr:cytochrome c biogenesis protein CcsA [Elusimicrobiota bacterium]
MDRIIARLVAAAFPALTVGLLLGLRWARLAYGTTWAWDAKVLWSVAIWAVYGFIWRSATAWWRGAARRTCRWRVRAGAVQLHRGQFFSKFHGFVTGKLG